MEQQKVYERAMESGDNQMITEFEQAGQVLGQAELHTQDNDKFIYTCNSCNKSVETRYVQYLIMIIVLLCIKN